MLSVAGANWSACTRNDDPRFAEYNRLMLKRPADAAREIQKRLAAPDATATDYRAQLYSALADAYSSLDRHEETRAAVSAGLELQRDHRNATCLNLLFLDALNPVSEVEIRSARTRAEALLKQQPESSPAQACVLLTLGLIEHYAGRPDQASIHLTRAYRASAAPERE